MRTKGVGKVAKVRKWSQVYITFERVVFLEKSYFLFRLLEQN
jgi:hypothetical protein